MTRRAATGLAVDGGDHGGAVLVVQLARRATVAQDLVGAQCWWGVVTDRWSADTWYPTRRRQRCGAHLLRDIDAMIPRGGRSAESAEAWQAPARQMCHWWPRVREGTLTHARFKTDMQPIRREVERRLEAGHTWGAPKTAGTCRPLLTRRQARWTVVRHAGVEPTPNTARSSTS